jgi:hypothetical protein
MRLVSEIIRSLLTFAVFPLGLAGILGFFQLLQWLVPSTNSREFGLWLFYAGPTLLALGVGLLVLLVLVYKVVKRSRRNR